MWRPTLHFLPTNLRKLEKGIPEAGITSKNRILAITFGEISEYGNDEGGRLRRMYYELRGYDDSFNIDVFWRYTLFFYG